MCLKRSITWETVHVQTVHVQTRILGLFQKEVHRYLLIKFCSV